MPRLILSLMSLILAFACMVAADESDTPLSAKPQWQRLLQGDDAKNAADLQERIKAAEQADEYKEAIALQRQLLDLRTTLQGADHWQTAQTRWDLDIVQKEAALSQDDLAAWRRARKAALDAYDLEDKGLYAQAEPLLHEYRGACEKFFGEKHLTTGASYNRLGMNLRVQGKYLEAELFCRKALELVRNLLGDAHPFTATALNNLALNLRAQAKYGEAQPLFEKALVIRRASLGENDSDTIISYNNLAFNLNAQGKHGEAQIVYQKILTLSRKIVGEKHPDTARFYNNLAYTLYTQGKYADAQPLYQKALDLRRELLGDNHPETADTYGNFALNFTRQQKYVEAQPLLEAALKIRRERLGDKHPDIANSYNSLAGNLSAQGKYAEAEPLYRKALDLRLELLGDKHPETADCYNNLAACLIVQGQVAQGQELCQKALDLRRDVLGENHPETTQNLVNLAITLIVQRKYADAAAVLANAQSSYESARLSMARRGLDRAVVGGRQSPYDFLAATEARLASPVAAWVAAETDLARGANDEAALRRGVTFTPDEERRQNALGTRLNQIQDLVFPLVAKQVPTDAEKHDLLALQSERRRLENEMSQLAAALSQREVATLRDVQAALPANGALLLWVDATDVFGQLDDHWACVVRHTGDPTWEPLPGSGPDRRWGKDDSELARQLNATISGGISAAEIAELARKLHLQRIAPVEKHLDGVVRLFVVPVNAMAGVPVEVLTSKYTVSYLPSGTFLARLKDRERPTGTEFLALGDPVIPRAEPPQEGPLPTGGLLITLVVPGGNAAQSRLQTADVLLKYAGVQLTSVEQFGKLIQEHAEDKSITVAAWRDGQTAERELAPGKLGVALDRQPAPAAILAKRKTDELLASLSRGGDWKELPGSAVEVSRLGALLGNEHATVLTRSSASEQALEQIRENGKLAGFRFLHFATHGEPNNARAFESALILSQDQISGDIPLGGGKYYDGRLTANEVLETWRLDNAELVTLSACESGLGRPGGGDGLLGFAQAFLLAGARSVCLSLWKVDDTATALLMDRFYQNLLGKRDGLAERMPKAEALAEGKRWLRNLTLDEATKLAANLTNGVARGNNEPALELVVPSADAPAAKPDNHPFSHPRYWAAFILIGDPD